MRVRTGLLLVVLVAATAGCSNPSSKLSITDVNFRSTDGFRLEAKLFARNAQEKIRESQLSEKPARTAVVLAHMKPSDQRAWFPTARELASRGYLVLTFNFRGYGSSEGKRDLGVIDRDVIGGVTFLRNSMMVPPDKVVLVGASMGGTASVVAASKITVDGVFTLSAPAKIDTLDAVSASESVTVPKYFLAAFGDEPAAESAATLYRAAADPRDIKIVAGADHGTDLLRGSQKKKVLQLIEEFIAKVTK